MYFKPRIFISSTMGDKLKIRDKIGKMFEEVGAEIALYEKNLTPSIEKSTYRSDILKTDFVIFIVDEKYGNPTENGISGTEEEFNIISSFNKPCHVYLKEIEKTDAAEKFEENIKNKGISFYYYKDEKELEKKIKSTCFTIARDILFSDIDSYQIDPVLIHNLAIHHDMNASKYFCKLMDEAINIDTRLEGYLIQSNLMIIAINGVATSILNEPQRIFIDTKCDELLKKVCFLIGEFTSSMANQSTPGPVFGCTFLGGIINISFNQWISPVNMDFYSFKLQEIKNAYNEYKGYLAHKLLEKELSKW